MTNNPAPNPVQYSQCAALIAKVMISEDGKFTESELANGLLEYSWNNNVTDFLHWLRELPVLVLMSIARALPL